MCSYVVRTYAESEEPEISRFRDFEMRFRAEKNQNAGEKNHRHADMCDW